MPRDSTGAVTAGGTAWKIQIEGGLGADITVGKSQETGGSGGDLYELRCTGNVGGAVRVYGNVGTFACDGAIESAVDIEGNLTRLNAGQGTSEAGTIDVGGDLGRLYSYRRRGRRRWAREGLRSGGDVLGDITVGGKAWLVSAAGDLADASISANEIGVLTVRGSIRSVNQEWIRSLLAGTTFYISDSTWRGYISDGFPHVFDGTVSVQIG